MKSCLNLLSSLAVFVFFTLTIVANAAHKNKEDLENIYNDLKTEEHLEELLEDYFLDRNKKNNNNNNKKSNNANDKPSCYESMHVKDKLILHTKQSVDNGAQLLDVEMIPISTPEIVLHEKCMSICCNSEGCDTALLNLQPDSKAGYRCYLFNCSSKCLYANHSDYSVMTQYKVTPTITQEANEPKSKLYLYSNNIYQKISLRSYKSKS